VFEEFDFSLLDSNSFKEDSVREEIVLPILKRLGYSASPPNQICRSLNLVHPYVYIGSISKTIHIVPDYTIKKNNANFFILDAKAPSENIQEGKNVEQAYSYAIHKDVRAELFALCNGKEFALYHISYWPALLSFRVTDIENHWKDLASLIGSDVVRRKATLFPDLGIALLRFGLAIDAKKQKIWQAFLDITIHSIAKLDEDNYSIQSIMGTSLTDEQSTLFMATFDFPMSLLSDFLSKLEPKELSQAIETSITHNPFSWFSTPSKIASIGLACSIADEIQQNENEQYLPFIVDEFI
jgi:hypothetical protein